MECLSNYSIESGAEKDLTTNELTIEIILQVFLFLIYVFEIGFINKLNCVVNLWEMLFNQFYYLQQPRIRMMRILKHP